MKYLPAVTIALFANSLFGAEPKAVAVPKPEPSPIDVTTQANSSFAFDLYKQLASENEGENLFFSPYSVSSALAMTAEGARGETALEMGKVLSYPEIVRNETKEIPWNMDTIHSGLCIVL